MFELIPIFAAANIFYSTFLFSCWFLPTKLTSWLSVECRVDPCFEKFWARLQSCLEIKYMENERHSFCLRRVIYISRGLLAGLIHKSSALLSICSYLLMLSAFPHVYSYWVYGEKAESLARPIPNYKASDEATA